MSAAIERSERLIVVVGPSGAGKDSVLRAWRAGLPADAWVHLARRTITRDAHPDSEDHEAILAAHFAAEQAAGAFALHWSAHGLCYGIRRGELAPLGRGGWVVMNGSRGHLAALRAAAPAARVVMVDAPAALRRLRLGGRAREGAASIDARLEHAPPDAGADLTILNDRSLADAVAQLDGWWRALRAMETA